MGDSTDVTPAKKSKVSKAKKPKTVPSHPKVSDMVNSAISTLKERGGSSLQAIKKYVSATYKVDAEKLSPFIKKYLKSAVASGGLVQTKGKGATGSFRMGGTAASADKKSAAKPKKAAVKSPKPKKAKAAVTPKKTVKPKKSPVKKPKSPAKKVKKPAAKKSPVKKPKAVKLVAPKAKKPKATPKKAPAKKGKK